MELVIPLPPAASIARSLPFESLSPRDFERLCLELAELDLGRTFHLYGRSGDAQHGIDVISDDDPDALIAIQCKSVEAFHPSDVQQDLAKVATYPNRLAAYYLFVRCEVSSNVRDFEASHNAATQKGPLGRLGIWDGSDLDRRVAKHPHLVGAYFGLYWRDYLHPDLKRDEITNGISAISAKVAELMKLILPRVHEGAAPGRSSEVLVWQATVAPWLDGYFTKADGVVELHGNFPSGRGFAFTHSLSLDNDMNKLGPGVPDDPRIGYSVVLSPDETLDLEAAVLMAQTSSSRDSHPVYYVNQVFIGGPMGTGPRISLPLRDVSFKLFSWASLWKLRALATSYLDRLEDMALAARRVRLLAEVAEGTRMPHALLHRFKFE
jgi:hypothetical protein